MTTSIVVDDVSKEFSLQYHRTLKQMTMAKVRGQAVSDSFWALSGVSFEVEQGESIGLMGLNGSGKSTLLKLICGVMKPDSGTVLTRGRISGLIATGAGFHQQLTGRENIYMNAAILGMSEQETNEKFDDIASFADVGRFMDTPVGGGGLAGAVYTCVYAFGSKYGFGVAAPDSVPVASRKPGPWRSSSSRASSTRWVRPSRSASACSSAPSDSLRSATSRS